MRTIENSVVVIVGATSGVGRATARSLAARGARLVIVARNPADVDVVVAECRRLRAEVVGAVADISDAADVERIVTVAVDAFGSIDTWINTASGLIVGELHEQPVDLISELVSTNVLGTALTSRAAMAHFLERGAGVLINVSSLLGLVPNPIVPTYSMSKYAIRGLTLSLHQSTLRHRGISVCTVLPGPIDTPMFHNAANVTGRAIRAIPPAFSSERVAAAVIRSVRRPRRQRTTGVTGALIMIGHHVVPRFTETFVAQVAARLIFRRGAASATSGALTRTDATGDVTGGWRRNSARRKMGDRIGRRLARGSWRET